MTVILHVVACSHQSQDRTFLNSEVNANRVLSASLQTNVAKCFSNIGFLGQRVIQFSENLFQFGHAPTYFKLVTQKAKPPVEHLANNQGKQFVLVTLG